MIRKTDYWTFLVYFLIFLIPTQIAYHFWPAFSLVYGIRVDYLAPAIYLTDILILLIVALKFQSVFKWILSNKLKVFSYIVFAGLNIIFSTVPVVSLLKWLKITEFIVFGLVLYKNKSDWEVSIVFKTLFFSTIFFGFIGLVQFLLKQTTGWFWFLGERTFSVATPGIAIKYFFGDTFLRAYSTFPHPNSFAGYVSVVFICLLYFQKKSKEKWLAWVLLFLIICLLISFSVSAVIALLIACLYFIYFDRLKTKYFVYFVCVALFVLSLAFSFFAKDFFLLSKNFGDPISERVELAFFANKMFVNNFWFGVGSNNFISNIPKYIGIVNYSWLLQPVHNIFLLIFSENGILGAVVTLNVLAAVSNKNNKLLSSVLFYVMISGLADHYWLTLNQNLLLLTIVVVVGKVTSQKSSH